MKSTAISVDDLRQVHWRVLTTANKIRQEKEFHPSPSPWCGNCDFISICPDKPESDPVATAFDQLEFWDDSKDDRG